MGTAGPHGRRTSQGCGTSDCVLGTNLRYRIADCIGQWHRLVNAWQYRSIWHWSFKQIYKVTCYISLDRGFQIEHSKIAHSVTTLPLIRTCHLLRTAVTRLSPHVSPGVICPSGDSVNHVIRCQETIMVYLLAPLGAPIVEQRNSFSVMYQPVVQCALFQ